MPLLLCLQKLQGKGDGEWRKKEKKKVSLHRFSANQKIVSSWKNVFCHPIAQVINYRLLPGTF